MQSSQEFKKNNGRDNYLQCNNNNNKTLISEDAALRELGLYAGDRALVHLLLYALNSKDKNDS